MLTDAGVERARAVVGAIDDANAAVRIVIAAGQLASSVEIVLRVGDEMDETLARRAGADELVIREAVSGE